MRRLIMTAVLVLILVGLGALRLPPASVMAGMQHALTPVTHAQSIGAYPYPSCDDAFSTIDEWEFQNPGSIEIDGVYLIDVELNGAELWEYYGVWFGSPFEFFCWDFR